MELFAEIRREYQFGEGTVKGVARKFGVHRRMVREALADAVPKQRKIIERVRPKLEPAVPFIDAILESALHQFEPQGIEVLVQHQHVRTDSQAVQAALDMDEIMDAATDGNYKLNVGGDISATGFVSGRGWHITPSVRSTRTWPLRRWWCAPG